MVKFIWKGWVGFEEAKRVVKYIKCLKKNEQWQVLHRMYSIKFDLKYLFLIWINIKVATGSHYLSEKQILR